jgi:hypothetical protein
MPWNLNTPIIKQVPRPARVSITQLRIQSHVLAEDYSAVQIIWQEGFDDSGTYTVTEAHDDSIAGAQVKAAFDAATQSSRSKREDTDQTLFELLESEGLIPAGVWGAT